MLTTIRKVCKFVHFTGGEVSNFAHFNQENVHVHFTGGEKVSNFAHFNQESVQICSLYWWERGEQYSAHFSHGEGEQICTPIEEVEKFAHIESYSAVSCQHVHKFVKN